MSASGMQNSCSVRRYSDGSWAQLNAWCWQSWCGKYSCFYIQCLLYTDGLVWAWICFCQQLCVQWSYSYGSFPAPPLYLSQLCSYCAIDIRWWTILPFLCLPVLTSLLQFINYIPEAGRIIFTNWYQRYNCFIYFRVYLHSSFYSDGLFVPFNYSSKCLQRVQS
jgi:hypothetical protein